MTPEEFTQSVIRCANTGILLTLPDDLSHIACGNIMADVAAFFIDRKEDIKAIIILEERRRLGV